MKQLSNYQLKTELEMMIIISIAIEEAEI